MRVQHINVVSPIKGEELKLEEIGENNYKDLYIYYLNKKQILC